MKLPRAIRIGAHTWRIKRMLMNPPTEAAYSPQEENGACSFDEHVIWIHPAVVRKPSLLFETLHHEITHVINEHCGVTDASTEEVFTTQVAKGWAQVALDNPKLLPYLQALLHPAAKPESARPRPESAAGDPARLPVAAAS